MSLSCFADNYVRAKFMPLSQATEKWGVDNFDSTKFQSGDERVRSAMAVDVFKNMKKYIGLTPARIRELFGQPDGYFWSDTILAYQIQYYKNSTRESWQIVFLPDSDLKKITEIKIHKKCCYKATKLVN
jgi:hypothetical protein